MTVLLKLVGRQAMACCMYTLRCNERRYRTILAVIIGPPKTFVGAWLHWKLEF